MPAPELLERPIASQPIKTPLSPSVTEIKRENIGLLLCLILVAFVVAVFLKLLDYEATQTFQWLHSNVQIDPAWY